MMMGKSLVIAVDFDGTVVEHKFPAIGKEMPFAFATLKALQKKGHRLIMWTYRHGETLDAAVEYCLKNGVEFYAINRSFPEEKFDPTEASRKLDCDMFIDDRNVGGFLGWGEIYRIIHPEEAEAQMQQMQGQPKKGLFGKLFGG
ncbi:MAG: hydrolase [Flavobacteriales bacterium]|nr:hydrolase [Flavobacteriales bacterium]